VTQTQRRIGLLAIVAILSIVAAALALRAFGDTDTPDLAAATDDPAATAAVATVRDSSHRLDDAGPDALTLVEFLDFECEACAAIHPLVEDLRADYRDRVTFVIRYFPLPGHTNSLNAAAAVEAAAQQGQLEAMYQRMYQTQAEWGEQTTSQAALFRQFAEDLGLDMQAYDATFADPATLERISQDYQDGLRLGVQGTPTFFLDGELITPTSEQDFRQRLDDALQP
jgi:protein-disulfide isomerase